MSPEIPLLLEWHDFDDEATAQRKVDEWVKTHGQPSHAVLRCGPEYHHDQRKPDDGYR